MEKGERGALAGELTGGERLVGGVPDVFVSPCRMSCRVRPRLRLPIALR